MTEIIRVLPDSLDPDEDGYPSDALIDDIRHANDTTKMSQWMVETFPRLVKSLPCGSVDVFDGVDDFNQPMHVITYSTGGWSGQEDLIHAVEHSLLGIFYLWSWRRGGHYEFRVPKQ